MLYKLKSDMDIKSFLDTAKHIAKKYNYDDSLLSLSNDNKHKLIYDGVKFGSLNNMDFIQYLHEATKNDDWENAFKHRERYLKRAYKIKGDWKDNINSPNTLAIRILWMG
jgi:hypothetical protein